MNAKSGHSIEFLAAVASVIEPRPLSSFTIGGIEPAESLTPAASTIRLAIHHLSNRRRWESACRVLRAYGADPGADRVRAVRARRLAALIERERVRDLQGESLAMSDLIPTGRVA